MRRQLARCAGVPCRRRGNQASGTTMVLPSARPAVSASSLTVTLRASAPLTSAPEILTPYVHKERLALLNHSLNSPKFRACKSTTRLKAHRIEPELRHTLFPLHVDVERLGPVCRVEEQPVWP